MTDPITIAEFKKLDSNKTYTSCIQVRVTSVSALTEGTTNGKKWKRQAITVSDDTDKLNLSIFNGVIGKFVLGKSYLICELAVDSWNGHITAKVVPKTTIREVSTSENFLKDKQTEIDSKLKSLPTIPIELEKLTIKESTVLYQIKKTVEKNISQFETLPNQGMIWQMTEKIYEQYLEK